MCSGAKTILDLRRTLEYLETLGVPVIGYGTDELPAFFAVSSGLGLEYRVDRPAEAARTIRARDALGMNSGIVFANPPPADLALSESELAELVAPACDAAQRDGVRGKALTPYLLERLREQSGGRPLAVNRALIQRNAEVAAAIACALREPATVPQ